MPEQISETTVHGQPWVGGAVRCDPGPWAEQDQDPLQLRLVPRPRAAAEGDEGAAPPDHRRPRHAGDVRRDRRERGGRQLRRRRVPDRRPGKPVTDTTAPLVRSARGGCRGNRCTVTVRATDASGIRRVELGVRSSRGVQLLAMSRKGKTFTVSLPRRQHELLVIATDNRGNESKPFRRTLTTAGSLARARHPRVIGGTTANAADYPFIGALIARGVEPGRRPVVHRLADRAHAVPHRRALRRRHQRVRLGRAVRPDRAVRHRRPAHPGHQPVVEPGLHRRAARLRRRPRAPRARPRGAGCARRADRPGARRRRRPRAPRRACSAGAPRGSTTRCRSCPTTCAPPCSPCATTPPAPPARASRTRAPR